MQYQKEMDHDGDVIRTVTQYGVLCFALRVFTYLVKYRVQSLEIFSFHDYLLFFMSVFIIWCQILQLLPLQPRIYN